MVEAYISWVNLVLAACQCEIWKSTNFVVKCGNRLHAQWFSIVQCTKFFMYASLHIYLIMSGICRIRVTQLRTLIPPSTPAASIPLSFNLNGDVHVLFSEKIDGPLPYVFGVRSPRCNNMDYS